MPQLQHLLGPNLSLENSGQRKSLMIIKPLTCLGSPVRTHFSSRMIQLVEFHDYLVTWVFYVSLHVAVFHIAFPLHSKYYSCVAT